MKRLAIFLLIFCLLPSLFGAAQADSDEKTSVVCTVFPLYDWVREILGGSSNTIEVTLLLDDAIDLHSYQPSVDDIIQISACDLFLYVGGESDAWVKDALKEAANEDMQALNLLDLLGDAAKAEEVVEGMEAEEQGHEHEEEGEEHEASIAMDEHIWLSLRNAQTLCVSIADALCTLDAANASVYQTNLAAYLEKLAALDAEYQEAISVSATKVLLFGDRFPFRYLVDDYTIDYYAAFVGCSAETEASFDTIIFLSKKMEALGLTTIMVTESSDQTIARTIRDNTAAKDQKILVLDAMQSVSFADIENGETYLSIMQRNLGVLKEALAQ